MTDARQGYQRHGYQKASLGVGMITTHLTRQKALMVLVSLGLLVLVVGLDKAKQPDEANAFAPSVKRQAAFGKPLEMREGKVTFTRIRVARSVQSGSGTFKKQINTSGIWVVVDYKFTAVREPASMDVALNSRDHDIYGATDRGDLSTKSSISGDPGFPTSGTFLFELPKNRLAGSYLTIGTGATYGGWPEWDDEGVVPLGIDEARAKTLAQNASPLLNVGG